MLFGEDAVDRKDADRNRQARHGFSFAFVNHSATAVVVDEAFKEMIAGSEDASTQREQLN